MKLKSDLEKYYLIKMFSEQKKKKMKKKIIYKNRRLNIIFFCYF